jgi:hypothetical protein
MDPIGNHIGAELDPATVAASSAIASGKPSRHQNAPTVSKTRNTRWRNVITL